MTSRYVSRLLCLLLLAVTTFTALAIVIPGAAVAKDKNDKSNEAGARAGDEAGKKKFEPCDHLPAAVAAAFKKFGKQCPAAGSSKGIAKGDFNGDGFADLAIGVPRENTPSSVTDSGAVIVVYGSASGLTTTDPSVPAPQFWSQNAAGVPDSSEGGDSFGTALAAGDFNRDGFSDLAIGAPGDAVVAGGTGSIGQVTIIFGSPHGLTTSDTTVPAPQRFTACDIGGAGTRVLNCQFAAATEADIPFRAATFGAALAWGDFDGDGIGDLAIGSPAETLGNINNFDLGEVDNAGVVSILFGSANGLSAARSQIFTLNSSGLPGPARAGDHFGAALVAGDFNGDAASDLVIGIPNRDVPGTSEQGGGTIANAGAVLVLFGKQGSGLTTTGRRFFDETDLFATANVGGLAGANDLFGSTFAVGDFDGDGRDDLAIGAHGRTIRGQPGAGAVWVQYSSAGALSGRIQFWEQSLVFPGATTSSEIGAVGSPTENGDHFGWALAAGDFNADGSDDLAIGVPFETLVVARAGGTFASLPSAGEVDVLYGASSVGLSISATRPPERLARNSIVIQAGEMYGFSLTAWNFGKNELRRVCEERNPSVCFTFPVPTTDLAIGVPGEAVGSAGSAGAVHVFYGSSAANGLDFFSEQALTHSSIGIGTSQAGEFFGGTLY